MVNILLQLELQLGSIAAGWFAPSFTAVVHLLVAE